MRTITRGLLCFSCLVCLSACEGNFSLWGDNYGLAFFKEGHYFLKDENKNLKDHIFDKPVLAYTLKESWLGKFIYDERHYDYVCRCGYRMSYDTLSFEEKEEGMCLLSYKRAWTGYDISGHTVTPEGGCQYRTVSLPYYFPSTYDGKEVTCIEENAFYDEKAEEAYEYQGEENAFPSVKSIKDRAFYKSSVSFPSLYFPNVSSIGERAFEGSLISSLRFGEKLTDLSTSFQPFAYAPSLEKVDLSECLFEALPNNSFLSSEKLKSVFLPDTLKTIGKEAFDSCKKLESLVIPASLETQITYNIFSGYYDQEIPVKYFFYKGSQEQAKAIFPSSLESRIYFYSEEKPVEEGSYWHYVDGEPVIYGLEEGEE